MIKLLLIKCSYSRTKATLCWVVFGIKIIHIFSFQINVSHNDNNGGNNNVSGRDGNTSWSNNNTSKVIDVKSIEPLTRYHVCIAVTYACFAILLAKIVIISLIDGLNYDPLDIDDVGNGTLRYRINELLTSIHDVVVVIAIILMFVCA